MTISPGPPQPLPDLVVFGRGTWYSFLRREQADWLHTSSPGYGDPQISVHIYKNNAFSNIFAPLKVKKVLKGVIPSCVEPIFSVFYTLTNKQYLKYTSSFWQLEVYGMEQEEKQACLKIISHVYLAIYHAITFIFHRVILFCHCRLLTDVTIYLRFYDDFDTAHAHLTISIWILRKYYIAFCRLI